MLRTAQLIEYIMSHFCTELNWLNSKEGVAFLLNYGVSYNLNIKLPQPVTKVTYMILAFSVTICKRIDDFQK